ncbi:GAF domain-containing protein [Streptomyces sp. NPDC001848]|uniref:GAF domain-containing protein n=1 Tax=Streptomyces sp. NPDC001848 TaxID=3364618 RepID=UPI00368B9643
MSTPVPYTPQYDPTAPRLVTPEDPDAPARVARLRQIGVGNLPVPEFDEFARNLARTVGAPYAMVNFINEQQQYFAGLFTPADGQSMELGPQQAGTSRVMARDHGWCPHVVVRKKALVLEDVCDYPRFAGNPVINEIGIRSYIGAPLIDWDTGIALGTVCAISPEITPWGRQGLDQIKSLAQQMVNRLREIEAQGAL